MLRNRYSHGLRPGKVIYVTRASSEGASPEQRIYPEMPTRKRVSTRSGSSADKAKPARRRTARPRKDPAGGLTAEGRKAFARKNGSHLRPGVKGSADTPEKMRRKGSFLRRSFTHPRGPMQRNGQPTRLALSAHAWGEPVPKTLTDAHKLAAEGKKLLEQYQRAKEKA